MKFKTKALLSLFFFAFFHSTYANISTNKKNKYFVFQLGGFNAHQGRAQNIGIQDLIGDRFTVNNNNQQNVLFGIGFFLDGIEKDRFHTLYGINAFYLVRNRVKGKVIQEDIFTNLSYQYSIANYPIYLSAKTLFKTSNDKYNITFDVGIGPNIIQTKSYKENSLDGITIPDNIFAGQTNVALSFTTGIGVIFNNVFKNIPLECGYRFFYLGKGYFKRINSQVINTLDTGNSYANALIFSITV